MSQNLDEPKLDPRLRCPQCNSADWFCWDERISPCWDAEGRHTGDKVVGLLKCKECGHSWADVAVDCEDGCTAEDDWLMEDMKKKL